MSCPAPDLRRRDRVVGRVKGASPPQNGSELRDKIRSIITASIHAKERFPSRALLRGLEPADFDKHVDYVLSDQVARLEAEDSDGNSLGHPDWLLVLDYEFQLRKKAYERVRRGDSLTLKEALRLVRHDYELKRKLLTTPYLSSLISPSFLRDRSRSRTMASLSTAARRILIYPPKHRKRDDAAENMTRTCEENPETCFRPSTHGRDRSRSQESISETDEWLLPEWTTTTLRRARRARHALRGDQNRT